MSAAALRHTPRASPLPSAALNWLQASLRQRCRGPRQRPRDGGALRFSRVQRSMRSRCQASRKTTCQTATSGNARIAP
eukprot:CAMPEP_0170428552 /NCGR_PEP_ID=MMETSP0117_2-20130122/39831_1 /TAXON_ID=400756 /ORGANISM="Durinskia baltica, Strain CSIRO CS-38" /LENGTH=77 /DNA_ID=CAMNT_0010687853 /DNA_START=24 /DNA_END=253 /DNA_ORIENTATION=-